MRFYVVKRKLLINNFASLYFTIKNNRYFQKMMTWIQNKKFQKDFDNFLSLSKNSQSRFTIRWSDRYPILEDNTKTTGFDRHYIYHPAWAARILSETKPENHVDISSTLYFCSIVSAFVTVKFYDFRPAPIILSNLSSDFADLIHLPFPEDSIQSLSCMHTVEHIGLGRYGDQLDPDGDLKAIGELKRVLAPGGNLLFVVPVGKPKIMFNAHRIYSYDQILHYFSEFKLKDFSLISDDPTENGIIKNASKKQADDCSYGCGCFWFNKV